MNIFAKQRLSEFMGQRHEIIRQKIRGRDEQYILNVNEELYDLSTDPGETENVIAEHPKVVGQLRKVYDQWWIRMQPRLVNEDAYQPTAKARSR